MVMDLCLKQGKNWQKIIDKAIANKQERRNISKNARPKKVNRLQSGLFTKKDSHFITIAMEAFLSGNTYLLTWKSLKQLCNFFLKINVQTALLCRRQYFFVKRQKYLLEQKFSEVRTSRPIVAKWIGELFQSYIWRNKMRF